MNRYEEDGYDEISGCSYRVHIDVSFLPNQNYTKGTIPLTVCYFGPNRTHFNQGRRFYLNRVPEAAQISGLDNVFTWLNESPTFPAVVGITTVELVTKALGERPRTNIVLAKVQVWKDEREEDVRRARARAAMERVKKFAIKETGEESCPVCMEEFRVGCDEAQLPCDHVFHGECVRKWFEIRISCPLCRFELGVDEVTASASTS